MRGPLEGISPRERDEHLPADRRHRPRPGRPWAERQGLRDDLRPDSDQSPIAEGGGSAHPRGVTRLVVFVLVVLALSAGAVDARGSDGRPGSGDAEVRVAGDCGAGAASSLRVRARDESIELRFRLRQTHGRGVWRITIVHENRISSRATRTTNRSDDLFELRRTLPDFTGSDTIVVRAWGPIGLGCRATATLPDSR